VKKIIYTLLLIIPIGLIAQNTYYVATDGDDGTGDGSIGNPWLTIQYGVDSLSSGDTLYIRGGTYQPSDRAHANHAGYVNINDDEGWGASGTANAYTCIWAYPGETPILDGTLANYEGNNYNTGIQIEGHSEYIHLKGLTISNVFQDTTADNPEAKGIASAYARHIKLENIVVHHIGGRGIYLQSGAYKSWYDDGGTSNTDFFPNNSYDTTLFINCDVHDICDSIDYTGANQPGNSGDAFKTIHYKGNFVNWTNCRMWNYTDDAIDPSAINGANIWIDNCWSMPGGGYGPLNIPSLITQEDTTYAQEQNGFKLAGLVTIPAGTPITWHAGIITNCIALFGVGGKGSGFPIIDETSPRGNHVLYNNTSYYHYFDYYGGGRSREEFPRTEIFRNNAAYYATATTAIGTEFVVAIQSDEGYVYTESHNTWDAKYQYPGFDITDTVTVTADDFLYGLDSATMIAMFIAERESDWSLPPNPLALSPISDLINSGTYIPSSDSVEFRFLDTTFIDTYNARFSTTPDIGAYEYTVETAKNITSFKTSKQRTTEVIDTTAHTVTLIVGGTKTSIAPTIIHTGASISPESGSSQDFTNPVTYTITAVDASTQEYTVSITTRNKVRVSGNWIKSGSNYLYIDDD
jgi:hypothetical protein